MTHRILGYQDRAEWNNHLSDLAARDIFFSPEYFKANEEICNGKMEGFLWEAEGRKMFYPYIKRNIPGSELFDITSPYGYGGLVGFGDSPILKSFDREFCSYCQAEGIVSEFVRFHPLFHNHVSAMKTGLAVRRHQQVVVAHYGSADFDFPSTIRKEAIKKVRKATSHNIKVVEDYDWTCLDTFIDMYRATMNERGATDFYLFAPAFFALLKENMPDRALLIIAECDDEPAGGLLLLHGEDYAYNYLSCSIPEFRGTGVNDLLQYRALEWALAQGKRAYLLGGGLCGEDSIFLFKAKYSPQRLDFFVGTRIHLKDEYVRLEGGRIHNDGLNDLTWFPSYRSPE